jgi:hypothetical protein
MHRNNGNRAFILAAAALVLVTVMAVGLVPVYMASRTTPTPTPTFEPFVLPTASDPYIPRPGGAVAPPKLPSNWGNTQRRTYCPECQAAGQSVNVWSDSSMQSVACRLDWNLPVAVVEQYGGMSLITGNGCRGWVRTSLLR